MEHKNTKKKAYFGAFFNKKVEELFTFLAYLHFKCHVNVIKCIVIVTEVCKYSPTCLLEVGRHFTSHIWISKIVHLRSVF